MKFFASTSRRLLDQVRDALRDHRHGGRLLRQLRGTAWIMAMLLYGAGLRLMECLRLRVKDVDVARGEVLVRDG